MSSTRLPLDTMRGLVVRGCVDDLYATVAAEELASNDSGRYLQAIQQGMNDKTCGRHNGDRKFYHLFNLSSF